VSAERDELDLAWRNLDRTYTFARSTERAPEKLIRRLLQKLEKEKPRHAVSLFLRAAFDEAAPQASWRAAVNALKAMGAQYSWGSKSKRDRLVAIATQPRLLAAAQTAAVGADEVPDEYLAVLTIDGSDTSLDALFPHFEAGKKDPMRLDGLVRLSTFAKKTPAMVELIGRAKEQLESRQAQGASLQLAHELGIANGSRFRVHVRCSGGARGHSSLDVLLDSASADDFRVWVFVKSQRTTFSAQASGFDDLKMGRCSLPELPQWLAKIQKTTGLRWKHEDAWSAYLLGKRLKTFVDWLLGPSMREVG
jgi:hypothetical protein